jgi:ribonuclease-3
MEQITPERANALREIEQKLGTAFANPVLLNQSLTHSSYGHDYNLPDNERLEFLGDAVLKLVISEYIYNKFPERAEGDLTKIRASVISDETLAGVARKLVLGDYLLLSENEKKTGGTKRKSNMANAFEAVIGGVYLDAGLGKVRDLLVDSLRDEVEKLARAGYIRDYKSALQEYAQKRKWELPHYIVVKETGPKHRRVFWMEVKIKGRNYGVGRGRNKKEAEQRSAMQALRRLKTEEKENKEIKRKEVPGLRSIISQVRKRIKI